MGHERDKHILRYSINQNIDSYRFVYVKIEGGLCIQHELVVAPRETVEFRCKAVVAWGPKEPMKTEIVEVAPPKKGEVRVKVVANALVRCIEK